MLVVRACSSKVVVEAFRYLRVPCLAFVARILFEAETQNCFTTVACWFQPHFYSMPARHICRAESKTNATRDDTDTRSLRRKSAIETVSMTINACRLFDKMDHAISQCIIFSIIPKALG